MDLLTPKDLIAGLSNAEVAEAVELGEDLADRLRKYLGEKYLIILMTAGPADDWLRVEFGA